MPIGPPVGGGGLKFHHNQQRPEPAAEQQSHDGDDGGGYVKKIYLLQPVQRPQTQPNLKGGGGFIGPVQNHIHVQPAAAPQVQRQGKNFNRQQHSAPGQSFEGDSGDSYQNGGGQSSGGNRHFQSKSEVKILPMIVIPPIAPMPPIQLAGGGGGGYGTAHASPKMTLQPQFNNYLVAPSGRKQQRTFDKLSGGGYYGGGGDMGESASGYYGGSGGGSAFRENYASRIRPPTRQEIRSRRFHHQNQLAVANSDYWPSSQLSSGRRISSSYRPAGDQFDDDFDYEPPPPQAYRPRAAARNGGWQRAQHARNHLQRHAQLDVGAGNGRVPNSIRDIVEAGTSDTNSNLYDYDEAPAAWPGAASSLAAKLRRQNGGGGSIHFAQQPFEISLDNIMSSNTADAASVAAPARLDASAADELSASGHQHQDLSATYYDSYSSGSPRQTGDLFDETSANGDELRFDTVKSVVHVDSSNATELVPPRGSAAKLANKASNQLSTGTKTPTATSGSEPPKRQVAALGQTTPK